MHWYPLDNRDPILGVACDTQKAFLSLARPSSQYNKFPFNQSETRTFLFSVLFVRGTSGQYWVTDNVMPRAVVISSHHNVHS